MPAKNTLIAGRYRIEQLLARGGMADVFAARDDRLCRPVAIKWIRATEPDHRLRFDAEIELLARLNHPNLVQILDAGEYESTAYLVLELIDGPTLSQLVADGPLDRDRMASLTFQVADALAYVHANGVIHRDVKPSNILLDDAGRWLLTDFGIARVVEADSLTRTGTTLGTARYMAPEQVEGSTVTPAADVYALGLVLLECLTAASAFAGPEREAALARLVRAPLVPADLEPEWRDLVEAMTARDPAARPSAAEVRDRTPDPPAFGAATQPAISAAAEPALAATAPVSVGRTELWQGPPPGTDGDTTFHRLWRGAVVAVAILALLALLIGVLFAARAGDGTTTASGIPAPSAQPTAAQSSTTVVPPTTAPAPAATSAVPTCATLQAERRQLDTRQHQIDKRYKKDPATRDQLHQSLEDQQHALDEQLRSCDD